MFVLTFERRMRLNFSQFVSTAELLKFEKLLKLIELLC